MARKGEFSFYLNTLVLVSLSMLLWSCPSVDEIGSVVSHGLSVLDLVGMIFLQMNLSKLKGSK